MKYQIEIKGIIVIIISALLLIIIGVGCFYWYEYRPSQIRKGCSKELRETERSLEARELFYKTCLREKGLEK